MFDLDRMITAFDNGLRTVFAPAHSARAVPGDAVNDAEMTPSERGHAAALMRVNHTGEICAQALYQGQALTARNVEARDALEHAAAEETDHLAWTAQRIDELGGRASLLNPLWYAGSFALGAAAGLLGDKWNLGFLAETERQVEGHLEGHLDRLPPQDEKSRAIVNEMKVDEARHAHSAVDHGAAELPEPVKAAMKLGSSIMTRTAYWI
ncbi:MAG: putative ubiquinone biosynthesis protein [Betaproteobacteria bacterium]|nr:putative ubiquinone biosynthesis protein [Betaproteobacteria bacterium]